MHPKDYIMVKKKKIILVAFLKLMKGAHTQGCKKNKYREAEVSQAHRGVLRDLEANETLFASA